MRESLLRQYIRSLMEGGLATSDANEIARFIVTSNAIEGYDVDYDDVLNAVEGILEGYPLRYVTNNSHIYGHLAGLQAAQKVDPTSVQGIIAVHRAMGSDVLDAGAPGIIRSSEVKSSEGLHYVTPDELGDALSWWESALFNSSLQRHAVYELIHPFDDGNGRSGRILLAADMNFNFSAVNLLIAGNYLSKLQIASDNFVQNNQVVLPLGE